MGQESHWVVVGKWGEGLWEGLALDQEISWVAQD